MEEGLDAPSLIRPGHRHSVFCRKAFQLGFNRVSSSNVIVRCDLATSKSQNSNSLIETRRPTYLQRRATT